MAILSNSGRAAYGLKKFMVRTVDDILNIPLTPSTRPGSTVFVTTTQTRYILDLDYNWVELNEKKQDDPDAPSDNEIIYEGGDISGGLLLSDSDYEGGEI